MEEKIIIEGKTSKKTTTILLKIGLCLLGFGLFLFLVTAKNSWSEEISIYALGDYITFQAEMAFVSIILDLGLLLSIYSFILWLAIKNNSITVTDKRVYGVTKWGKRVDLPLNQISAVSTTSLSGIAVGTSSGKIAFKAIENHFDVHSAITDLLSQKQDSSVPQTSKSETSNSFDELKNLKELLDSGIISQEEFDAKKKQLLGL